MKLTKNEIKAIISRCEEHTGSRKSQSLILAIHKLKIEVESWKKQETNK
jgi:hypothetical protein